MIPPRLCELPGIPASPSPSGCRGLRIFFTAFQQAGIEQIQIRFLFRRFIQRTESFKSNMSKNSFDHFSPVNVNFNFSRLLFELLMNKCRRTICASNRFHPEIAEKRTADSVDSRLNFHRKSPFKWFRLDSIPLNRLHGQFKNPRHQRADHHYVYIFYNYRITK